jgi:hypothetical protein
MTLQKKGSIMAKSKKDDQHKHSSARLYEFTPSEGITQNNIVELAKIVRVGVSGDLLKKLSPELQKHFKEVA